MKSFYLSTVFLLFGISKLGAQFMAEIEVGTNLSTGQPISAIEYYFPEPVYDLSVDSTDRLMTVRLRGLIKKGKAYKSGGTLLLYDKATGL